MLEVVGKLVLVAAAFALLPLLVGQAEHKVMAHMQGRLGPMYAGGFHGWAQLVADGVKFAQKEDVVPRDADRWVFKLAPGVAIVPYLLVLLVVPVGPGGQVALDLGPGVFFALAVMGVGVIGAIMAGWASANKYSLLGGMRVAAQLMSYELRRPPFDMPVADSEIIFGPYTEYGGLRFALFILAEYAGIVVLCALTTVLFLGGWKGPFLNTELGWLWTLIKVGVLAFCVIWLRVSYPRMREDQLQKLAWAWLVPLSLAQLALTGVLRVLS